MEKVLKAIDFRFYIGCPCHIKGFSNHSTIESVNVDLNKVVDVGVSHDPDLVKPILRKFENLSRHEVEQLNKLWPAENIKRTTFDSIKLDADIINYLTSLHVDVFGWIEQGLAIDAEYNTNN